MFSTPPEPELSDDELADLLRQAMLRGTGHRIADGYLATLGADFLVDQLRLAGLVVMRAGDTKPAKPG